MNNRPRRPLIEELTALEADLAALTLRVADLRIRAGPTQPPPRTRDLRVLQVGDRVEFNIVGRGPCTGEIVGITPQRVRVREDTTRQTHLRAPRNVRLL